MKKSRLFTAGALVLMLALGLVLAGCDTDGGGGGGGGNNSGYNSGNTGDNTGGNTGGGPSVPSAPTGVTATATSSSSILITWAPVSEATSYKVYYKTYSSGGSTDTSGLSLYDTTSSTSITVTGLSSSTTYIFYVKASNSAGDSAYGMWDYEQTNSSNDGGGDGDETTVPDAPTNVRATTQLSSSIVVSWNEVSNATGYKVYRSSSSEGTYSYLDSLPSTSLSYTDAGLPASATYFYKVSAYNSAGESSLSLFYRGMTNSSDNGDETIVPGAPTNVSATALSSDKIMISWSAPSSGGTPTYYNIWRATSAYGTYEEIKWVSSPTLSYTDTGLNASTTYYYRVDAENNAGRSSQSVYDSATTSSSGGGGGTPAAPTNVSMSLLLPNENGFKVSWGSVTGASSYNVYRSTTGNFGTAYRSNVTGTSIDDTSVTLTYNTSYYYRITAVNSSGTEGNPSTTVRVTVPKVEVSAYKPATSGEVITPNGIRQGGIKIGDTEIRTEYTSASTTSASSSILPGTYELATGFSSTTGTFNYYTRGNITLKPWHTYVISVHDGSIKSNTVNFVYY